MRRGDDQQLETENSTTYVAQHKDSALPKRSPPHVKHVPNHILHALLRADQIVPSPFAPDHDRAPELLDGPEPVDLPRLDELAPERGAGARGGLEGVEGAGRLGVHRAAGGERRERGQVRLEEGVEERGGVRGGDVPVVVGVREEEGSGDILSGGGYQWVTGEGVWEDAR
jgi:hypothetical protein